MPIINRQDAAEVEHYIARFFAVSSNERDQALRRLFVEKLDFAGATGAVSLANAPKTVALPPQAERIASMEGLHVVYVPLSGNGADRVRKAEAAAAAKLITDSLHGDLLMVMTNPSCSQLHVIYPTFLGAAPSLRRMIIERDLPRRTAVQQFSNIFWQWKDTGSIRLAVDWAFDVEAVTKQFFEEYKRVFERTLATVEGFGPSKDQEDAKKLFVQTMFNRLMFIYFLSRKGWLKFRGDPDYLNALRKDYPGPAEKNFYDIRLKLLFFAGLNNDASRDVRSSTLASLIGDVPFLNGGLFEETPDDKRPNILVPDTTIDQILRELFDKFNFTVMESTPFDVEVAVDPEMLGKVFEELVTGRHESGSYYTPRPVVSFMCREALKGYLETQNTGASTEAIAAFVDHKDTSNLTLSLAPKISEALPRVKVVDPACGSGAYLLGMMQELVELMTALYSAQLSHQAQDLYNLKLRIIERNLYGADIDQFAVNIAMLRLWLSLAIDYDGPVPPPLPNLDFKIVCGDSLLGPDPSPENYGDLFRHRIHQLAGQLAALKARHMGATGQEKTNLTEEIEGLKAQLREALANSAAPEGAVDWRVEFAEVFDQNGGFDIAIANPPYVRYQEFPSNSYLSIKGYSDGVSGKSDIYCFFYLRALQILKQDGMHVFVCSSSWLDTNYGEKLQAFLLSHSSIVAVYDSLVERQFATAQINTIISILKKVKPSSSFDTKFVSLLSDFDWAISDESKRRELILSWKEIWTGGFAPIVGKQATEYQGGKWGGRYLRAPSIFFIVQEKVKDKGVRLGSIAEVNEGKPTGANDFFYVPIATAQEFGLESEFLHPAVMKTRGANQFVLGSRHIDRLLFATDVPKSNLRGSGALRYIEWGENQGINKGRTFAHKKTWYSLQVREPADLLMPCGIGSTFFCAKNNAKAIASNSFAEIRITQKDFLPLIWMWFNSVVGYFYVEILGRRSLGGGLLKVDPIEYRNMPVLSSRFLGLNPPGLDRQVGLVKNEVGTDDRRALDDIVFDSLGLSRGEEDAIYETVVGLAQARIEKASSIVP